MAFKFDGMLFEIFSKLPSKALFKCRIMCKEAHNLPSDNRFVKKQCVNMQGRDDLGFLLQNSFWCMRQNLEIHPLSREDCTTYGLPSKSLQFLTKAAHILVSSNGLLLCLNKIDDIANDLFICNPVTQRWFPIPIPDDLSFMGDQIKVVFDCNTGDSMEYNLMVLVHDPKSNYFSPNLLVKIYSPKERKWEEIGKFHRGKREIAFYHMPIYDKLTENLYVLSNYCFRKKRNRNDPFYWPYVLAYNIKTSESKLINIPKDARKGSFSDDCRMDIFKWWQGNLCLVQLSKGVFRVWVMKENNKWVRILKMRARAMIAGGLKKGRYICISGITVLNGKSLLFTTNNKVYHYDLKGHDPDQRKEQRRLGEEISEHDLAAAGTVIFHSYANTLRPCGDGAKPMPINL